jgi:hypothetical protein
VDSSARTIGQVGWPYHSASRPATGDLKNKSSPPGIGSRALDSKPYIKDLGVDLGKCHCATIFRLSTQSSQERRLLREESKDLKIGYVQCPGGNNLPTWWARSTGLGCMLCDATRFEKALNIHHKIWRWREWRVAAGESGGEKTKGVGQLLSWAIIL